MRTSRVDAIRYCVGNQVPVVSAARKIVRAMCTSIFGLVVAFSCFVFSSAFAASMGVVVGSFAMACMNNVETPSGMSELNKGGVQLRPEHADPILKPDRGTAYLHKFDNGGEMVVAIKETGGCKIYSKEALRPDVDGLIFEIFRRERIPSSGACKSKR